MGVESGKSYSAPIETLAHSLQTTCGLVFPSQILKNANNHCVFFFFLLPITHSTMPCGTLFLSLFNTCPYWKKNPIDNRFYMPGVIIGRKRE